MIVAIASDSNATSVMVSTSPAVSRHRPGDHRPPPPPPPPAPPISAPPTPSTSSPVGAASAGGPGASAAGGVGLTGDATRRSGRSDMGPSSADNCRVDQSIPRPAAPGQTGAVLAKREDALVQGL